MNFDSRCHCLGGLRYAVGITVLSALRSPLRGQLKLLKIIPDNFLDFRAGEAMATHLSMDGHIRAMQGAYCRGCQSRNAH